MRLGSQLLIPLLALGLVAGASSRASFASPPEQVVSCGQSGRVAFDKDTVLLDATGRRIARFSGGESAVRFLAPPRDGGDLARIETGIGRGSFRLQGFVKASELRIFAAYAVPIVSGHVWFDVGTRVTPAGTSAGRVRLEKQMSTPFNQRFTAFSDCSALTFSPPAPSGLGPPGNARVYLMKGSQLELFGEVPPTGSSIMTLQRSPTVGSVRFFSTEQRGGFVHVLYRSELRIDAWARASDLTALPRGETADVPASSYLVTSPPQLQLQQAPRIVVTKRELPLRIAAREADTPVGVIEPDTEVYVMDTVAGWANVLPKSLHLLPADNLSFWVKASDLGI